MPIGLFEKSCTRPTRRTLYFSETAPTLLFVRQVTSDCVYPALSLRCGTGGITRQHSLLVVCRVTRVNQQRHAWSRGSSPRPPPSRSLGPAPSLSTRAGLYRIYDAAAAPAVATPDAAPNRSGG
ncbi:hypothetical protein EVAR_52155_1 [Eumeta japonica]|uniref:Uncharacterized protein n=1 Tax=Eumeta variegata TaxID=151549 RepID=A0A4C1Y9R5_EUMVA|nr:hypothetical protein EVAR_52155_1 [Eumeta japonica]